MAGENLPRREPKRAYNGAEGLPIREEVIARHGESVITRNSYGALCLNSPNAMFVDIDFYGPRPATQLKHWIRTPLLVAAVVIGLLSESWMAGLISIVVALMLAALSSTLIYGPATQLKHSIKTPLLVAAVVIGLLSGSWVAGLISVVMALMVAASTSTLIDAFQFPKKDDLEDRANTAIEAFAASHPDWRPRQYRTPGGFRLLAMHRTFDPREPEVQACFQALRADPVYALMCVRQHCFRARVSPKPWRIGIFRHMRPRPGVWPIRPERLAERRRWVADYERLATNYAACSYRRTLGGGGVDPAVEQIRQLHDRMAQAEHALPMARRPTPRPWPNPVGSRPGTAGKMMPLRTGAAARRSQCPRCSRPVRAFAPRSPRNDRCR
ncbi:MAG TPA: hypothetical protein VK325_03545 [Pseudoxanthomonas sp.]|nr:hypothetical protein [Pseudoxanthomonas sp.]